MQRPSRRRFIQTGLLTVVGLAGCATPGNSGSDETDTGNGGVGTDGAATGSDGTAAGDLADLELGVETLATGFTSPVGVSVPAEGTLYVVDQPGQLYRVTDGGDLEVALDIRDRVVDVSGYDERGLLGAAFHPDFDGSGRVFLRYSAPRREGTPDSYSHTFVLSSFQVSDGSFDPESERTVLEIPQPQANHNAGSIAFGPDGYLYVGVGDGGGANDQGTGHVDDWYDAVPGGNGQDVTENLLGSILRINVDTGGDSPYAVPEDNPLVDGDGLGEQYAWGFRNPWRFSFGPGSRLFVADVGQNEYEEVNVVERGGNYGWNVREATHCFGAENCPGETPDGDPLIDPIIEYPHGGASVSGISVIGGYLYDGDAVPALQGHYVFADWRADGQLFVARERDDGLWPVTAVPVADDGFGSNVLSFGRTTAGELLVCTTDAGGVSGNSGAVHRIRQA
ncbi:PQQ-dependent sugar dehydrogenase [Haloarcula sp. S1AR25-5A]|uniref:PQQ-dependent sugar dehydrogenase n=1 Tax=Haloarcula terrestris TaxID=2950533 RepID=A0AAE4EVY7_9EURY|nr:PQQ-dependent sugar dehydrogenase [Haloarcula terrestris]MDS0221175.1 PQQ-dependent sugar dehydrogenase [Haloarcula terrestris]